MDQYQRCVHCPAQLVILLILNLGPLCLKNQGGSFNTNLEDTAHIINGCKKQDLVCQEKLYKKFYPALFALCKTFFDDNQEILTALNNGMLKVFKNIDQYDPAKGTFFNWTYTIVRNAALTLIRDNKNKLTFELTESIQEPSENNPFRQLEWKDIYFYLGKLPSRTRCVCTLFYLEGFTIKEIVNALDMKEGAVKWHLHECRDRLKIIFEQYNIKNIG
ncbi:MAG: sigma-70 family RNA polymerase sigma factor [Bacteroidetes bacterium]|nr:sigma-70 family RNA polymerase sigma factor [Bacteroidota bacterium]